MQQLLSQARSILTGKRKTTEARYRELLRLAAADKPVDPAELVAVLELLGVSVDEFAHAAENFRLRIALRKKIDALPGVEARLSAIDGQRAQLAAELAAAQERHDGARRPLDVEAERLVQEVGAAQDARSQLCRTADPDATAELASATAAANKAAAELSAARDWLAHTKAQRAEPLPKGTYKPQGWAAEAARIVEEAARRVAAAEREYEAATTARDAAERRLLDP